jgi:replication-associated recombination protein RarA
MKFSSDVEMQRVSREAQEFFDKVLFDEQSIFVSDEATIWDVSTSTAEDLLERCSKYYGKSLSVEDLKQPLWKLLRQLNEGRKEAEN